MSWNHWRSPLLAGVALSVACAVACRATVNKRTGELFIEFAPDMTISAMGLEDALDELVDLLTKCTTGTFTRPCTQAERDDIRESIDNVIDAKRDLRPEPPEETEEAEA